MTRIRSNDDVRKYAKERRVFLWQIAEALQINDGNLSRKLRRELPEAEKRKVVSIIDEIAEQNKEAENERLSHQKGD